MRPQLPEAAVGKAATVPVLGLQGEPGPGHCLPPNPLGRMHAPSENAVPKSDSELPKTPGPIKTL